MKSLFITSGVLIAAGISGAVWSSTRLIDGFIEIPFHWWSTFAVLPLFFGLALTFLGLGLRTLKRAKPRP